MTTQKVEIGAPYGAAEGSLTPSLAGSLLAFVGRIATDLVRYRSFRKAEMELHALDDRMLNDIGINRSEITSSLVNAGNERRRNNWRI